MKFKNKHFAIQIAFIYCPQVSTEVLGIIGVAKRIERLPLKGFLVQSFI